jgi:hypothetical protein
MSYPKIENCDTACCDCSVACKYNIIEDLCEQDSELFAHFMEVNNDYNLLISYIFGEVETAMVRKIVKILWMRLQSTSEWYRRKYGQKNCENAQLNKEQGIIITILG